MSEFAELIFWVWVLPSTFLILSRLKRIDLKLDQMKSRRQLQEVDDFRDRQRTASPNSPEASGTEDRLLPETVPQPGIGKEKEMELDSVPDQPPPIPRKPKPVKTPSEPGAFELAAKGLLTRIWNWIVVGDEYRKPGVSVEFAIATNWLVRIGVLILVVGVGFFLDYSARMGWLGDVGKVSLAGFTGGALVGWGMANLNKKYHLLGQGLVGAGLAILYTSVFAAHQRYELIPPMVAFLGMFLVTVGSVGISVYSRSLLIAVLGIVGGYLTPFLLPDSGELSGLFVYLAVLGSGVLIISIRRQWFVLNLLAFLFTTLHMFAVLMWWDNPLSFQLAMPFLILYFLIFSTSTFLFQVLWKEKSTWLDLGFLLLNAGAFFLSARELVLQNYTREAVSVVTLFLAVFYALHLGIFIKRNGQDKGLALCFISLSSLFLVLTVPLYFSENWWTLTWSLLALILLLGSQKVNSRFLEQIAFGLFSLCLYRFLLLDASTAYSHPLQPEISPGKYFSELASRFMQMGVPLAALGAAYWSQQHPLKTWPEFQLGRSNDCESYIQNAWLRWVLRGSLLGLGFLVLHLEVFHSFSFFFPPALPTLLTLVWVGFGWVLLRWSKQYPGKEIFELLLLVFSIAFIAKWLFWDLQEWGLQLPEGRFSPYSFLDAGFRFLDFVLRGGFLVFGYMMFQKREEKESVRNLFGYASLALLWIYTTLEIHSLLAAFVPGLRSGGLSVFWGAFALCLVSVGLVKRFRPLRFLGLGLFSFVAVKVFFIDLASLDPLYKIVAFILLGMVLLGAAFVYLRFQDRFSQDEPLDS